MGRTHIVTLRMAKLTFYRIIAPQPGLTQSTACHRPKTVPTYFRFSIVSHRTQRIIHSVFAHDFLGSWSPGKSRSLSPLSCFNLSSKDNA